MKASLGEYFALLIASGKSDRCDSLRSIIHSELIGKCDLFYSGQIDNPEEYKLLRKDLAEAMRYLIVDPYKRTKKIEKTHPDRKVFRKFLEDCMTNGNWSGQVGYA